MVERGPDGGQISEYEPVCLLRGQPGEVGRSGWGFTNQSLQRLISECTAVIMELEEGIKGKKYNFPNLAKAALETTKYELDEYTNYSRKAEIAISAIKEDPNFYNILNNLKDERAYPLTYTSILIPICLGKKEEMGNAVKTFICFLTLLADFGITKLI